MSRECGSFDSSPILKELQAIRSELSEQRQAIKMLGKLVINNDQSGGNDGGYQEASFASVASAGRNILKILQVVGTILGIVTNIQRLVEKFTGKQGEGSGSQGELEKLVRMIKNDTAKIGGRVQSIESKVNAMERKVNDALFVINRTRPEIAKILPLEKKVNDTLFIAQRTRPEIAKIVPLEKKVNDSLYVLNVIRPEIKSIDKKSNDAAYAASQASSKGDKILLAIAALSVSMTAQFTASGLKTAALLAIETKATIAAMALQTKTILAAIGASGLRDLITGILRDVLATQINSVIDAALGRFFNKPSNGTGSYKEILDAINKRSDAIIVAVNNGIRGLSELELNRLTNMETRLVKEGVRSEERILKELYATVNRVGDALNKLMRQRFQEIDETTLKVYQILGGEEWGGIKQRTGIELQPEKSLESVGNALYAPNATGRIRANNLIQLIYSVATPQYFRTGLHRLPAQVPQTIHYKRGDKNNVPMISIDTLVDYQKWQFDQLDTALGAFPIEIKYKNEKNEEKQLVIENISEFNSEIMGILLSLASESDMHTELIFKGIAETIKGSNTSIYVSEHIQAISEWLGYKGTEIVKEVPYQINPTGKTLREMMTPSTQKIAGWDNKDEDTLMDHLKKLLFFGSIIHSVFYKTDGIPGDRIKESLKNNDLDDKDQPTQQKQEWDAFIDSLRNPPAYLRDATDTTIRVKDYSNIKPGENPEA